MFIILSQHFAIRWILLGRKLKPRAGPGLDSSLRGKCVPLPPHACLLSSKDALWVHVGMCTTHAPLLGLPNSLGNSP